MTVPYICTACRHRVVQQLLSPGNRRLARLYTQGVEGLLADAPSPPRSGSTRYSGPHKLARGFPRTENGRHSRQQQQQHVSRNLTQYLTSGAATTTSGRYPRINTASSPPKDPLPSRTQRPTRAYTSELGQILRRGDIGEAWDFFSRHYIDKDSPALANPAFQDVAKVRRGVVFLNLLSGIIGIWQARLNGQNETPRVPSLVEVMKRFDTTGLASASAFSIALWTMSTSVYQSVSDGQATPERQYEDHIQELMDIWKLCLGQKALESQVDNNPSPETPWSFMRNDLIVDRQRSKKDFDQIFSICVPLARLEGARIDGVRLNVLAASALITYDLLTHAMPRLASSSSESRAYMGFAKSLENLIKHTTLEGDRLREVSRRMKALGVSDGTVAGFMERLEALSGKSLTAPRKKTTTEPHNVSAAAQAVISSLGRAVEKADLARVEKLWTEMQSLIKSQERLTSDADRSVKIYEQFIIAFFQLRRPQSASEVWTAMLQSGIQPTVRTWSVMLRGCHYSKDVRMMEAIWQRMRESGTKPDSHAWSTRIYGILRGGRHTEGLQALAQMGEEWLQATKPRQGKAVVNVDLPPKPDTSILNSALTGLRGKGRELMPRVLAWSSSFDIEPDVITYNALLNVAMSEGQHEQAVQILKRMSDSNVKADSSTLTILINSMFHSRMLHGLGKVEQEQAVIKFLKSIEAMGVSVDEKGYSLLVDRILKEHKNPGACQKILSHMKMSGVPPTPAIYTIFMTYHFDQDPPDFYAIDALWNQIQSRNNTYGTPLDVIFFDRMLEGYARHGLVGQAMTVLTRMSKEGKRPGWLAMIEVVKCLAAKGEWDRLTHIVGDLKRQETILSAGIRGTKGQREFYDLIEELGISDRV